MKSNESTARLLKSHWFGMEQQLCHECPVTNPTAQFRGKFVSYIIRTRQCGFFAVGINLSLMTYY